nr:interferon-induced helicase C domain-containing protein 1 isoform X1 [Biomphalaria glabrata]
MPDHSSNAILDCLVHEVYRPYIEEHVNVVQVAELMPCMKEVLASMRSANSPSQATHIFLQQLRQTKNPDKFKELSEALLQAEYEVLYCALDCGPVCYCLEEHKKMMSLFTHGIEETFSPSEVGEQLACRGVLAIDNFQAIKSLEDNGNHADAVFLLFDSLARQNEEWYQHLLCVLDCCEYTKLVTELEPTYYEQRGADTAKKPAAKIRSVTEKTVENAGAAMGVSVYPQQPEEKCLPTSEYRDGRQVYQVYQDVNSEGRKGMMFHGQQPENRKGNACPVQMQDNRKGITYHGQMQDNRKGNSTLMGTGQGLQCRPDCRQGPIYSGQEQENRNPSTYPLQAPVSRQVNIYPEQVQENMKGTLYSGQAPEYRPAPIYAAQVQESRQGLFYPAQTTESRRGTINPDIRPSYTYSEQTSDGRTGTAYSAQNPDNRPSQIYQGLNPETRPGSIYKGQTADSRTVVMYSDQVADARSGLMYSGPTADGRAGPAYPEQGSDVRTPTSFPGQNSMSRLGTAYAGKVDQIRDSRLLVAQDASLNHEQNTDFRDTSDQRENLNPGGFSVKPSRIVSLARDGRIINSKSIDSIPAESQVNPVQFPIDSVGNRPMESYRANNQSQQNILNKQTMVRVASFAPGVRPSSAGAAVPCDQGKCPAQERAVEGGCKFCIGNLPCTLLNNQVRKAEVAQAGGATNFQPGNDTKYIDQHSRPQYENDHNRNLTVTDCQLGCVRQQLSELTCLVLKQMTLIGHMNDKVDRVEAHLCKILEFSPYLNHAKH